MMRARSRTFAVVLGGAMALLCCSAGGCGGSSSTGPGDSDHEAGRVYVDGSYSGDEDGTAAHPFDTIPEGIDAASRGDTVMVAAGTYDVRYDIEIPKPMTIRGAGTDLTIVNARFLIEAEPDTLPVRVRRLACESVNFWGNRPEGGIVASRAGRDTAFAPIVVDSCTVDFAGTSWPAGHSYTIRNSIVNGSVVFNHGGAAHAGNVVLACTIADSVDFAHGGGDIHNTLEDCTVGKGIHLRSGEGPTYSIQRNTCHGIFDASGGAYTTIAYNTLPSGNIEDRSGALTASEEQFIEHNTLQDGVIELVSAHVTCRYNTVTTNEHAIGIDAKSGAPTNIVGNVVNVPYQSPVAGRDEYETVGVRLYCGDGVMTGNTIIGGLAGILDASGLSEISSNSVSGAHHGIVVRFDAAAYHGNTVTQCVGDGILILGDAGAFSFNTITNNGGAGVRLVKNADFGGGAYGSAGGNTITGNTDYDFFATLPADSAAVVYAEGNHWDHATEADIDAFDIYDANDDPSLADVEFMPTGTRSD